MFYSSVLYARRRARMKRLMIWMTAAFLSGLLLAACGNSTGQSAVGRGQSSNAPGQTLEVSANPTVQYAFAPDALVATANQPFSIQFANPSQVPHTLVLVQPGQQSAALAAGASLGGRVPENTSGVIDATRVLNNGESEVLSIQGLAAGDYPFICTVPGHYEAGMKGILTVKP